jgi:hypothetical protein
MTAQDETKLELQYASGAIDTSIPQRIEPAPKCLDLIAEVHTRVLDTLAGFEKVVEKAQPDFKPVAKAFLAMHLRHEAELANALSISSRDPSADGSVFGAINRAAVEIKSWFEDVTDKIMDQVKFAELHILDAYSDAQNACQCIEIQSLITAHIKDIDALMSNHSVRAKGS